MHFVPSKMFLTKGVGVHKLELRSFEIALRDAGIEKCNLVMVSSILPPRCKIIPRKQGLQLLQPGQITFAVMARATTNEPHRLIAASIGLAIPSDENAYGYLSELHGYGMNDDTAGDQSEDMAAAMLASTLGVEFNEDAAWDEKKEVFKISDKIVKTTNITQTAVGHPQGLFTTCITAAICIF
ncbi:MAG: arginine decarboxylase, pyruvoyl-dependent [Verrucomicrobiae bacterium]|nr:arginine decarboxylase, pyruvoyl-dependent [Verrucomicrobiae bacterium]